MSRWPFTGSSARNDHPLIRLTVMGLSNSGKSSLISAWVNNVCPTMYTPTETATLYYRSMRVQNFLLAGGDSDALMSVLVEIEDTYSLHKQDGKDAYGQERNFRLFFDTRTPAKYKTAKREAPFKDCEPPSLTQYNPLSKARMGFLIVFDATDQQSFASAMEIYESLKADKSPDDVAHKIYLVANKIDKDPLAPEFKRNMLRAESYAKEKNVRLMEVSALEFTRVQRLFRDIVEEILQEPSLWMTEAELAALKIGEKHTDNDSDQNCTVQ